MPAKKHKPEEIIGKLREARDHAGSARHDRQGLPAYRDQRADPGLSRGRLYYHWRKEYGGLKTDQARRMKNLEKENLRLRRTISDLTLDKLILQE